MYVCDDCAWYNSYCRKGYNTKPTSRACPDFVNSNELQRQLEASVPERIGGEDEEG